MEKKLLFKKNDTVSEAFPAGSSGPPLSAPDRPVLRRTEWAVALAASAFLIALHLVYMLHAGGLWRDEVVSVSAATMPTFSGIWEALRFDSFPGAFHLVLRSWVGLFGEADLSLRTFGAGVGITLLAAFWLNGYLSGHRIPFIAILLFGLSPLAIQHGDSARAYGLGMLTMIVTFGLFWKATESSAPKWTALATLSAVLAVQTLYQNSFFVLAAGLGGMVVCARRGEWKRVAVLVGIGSVAALSVLPYLTVIARMREGKSIIHGSYQITLPLIWEILSGALASSSGFMRWTWVGFFLIGVAGAAYLAFAGSGPPNRRQDLALYSVTAAVVGTFGFWVFLKVLNFQTQPRYYLPLMAFVVAALDVIFSLFVRTPFQRVVRLASFVIVVLLISIPTWRGVHVRQTVIDLVAVQLEKNVVKEDLILVSPWYLGTTFKRYYRGPAPWTTLPPLERIEMQPLVLFKAQMVASNPIQPAIDQIARTLESGHRVWLVGGLPFLKEGETLPKTPPAPHPIWGWDHDRYAEAWEMQAAYFIQTHSTDGILLSRAFDGPVNPYEDLDVFMVRGWQA